MEKKEGPTVVIAYDVFGVTDIERDMLSAIGAHVIHTGELASPKALAVARTADALMVTIEPVTAAIIDSLECCGIISRAGTGVDSIDLAAATRKGILVTNVADYSVDEVSTHAITLLLACARHLPVVWQATRQGVWDMQTVPPITRLMGQTLGLLGFGRIAQAAARKGFGLGLGVISHDPYVDDAVFAAAGVESVSLEELLRRSDYLSLHAPLTPQTERIINATTLAQMKPRAYLINTARGGLIDETALVEALAGGQIAGAALDVLVEEPPSADHSLVGHERVILTPHMAWYSEEATEDVRRRAAEEVVRFFRGEAPRSPVNLVQG